MQVALSIDNQMVKSGHHPFCEEFSKVGKHACGDLNDVKCGKVVVMM